MATKRQKKFVDNAIKNPRKSKKKPSLKSLAIEAGYSENTAKHPEKDILQQKKHYLA